MTLLFDPPPTTRSISDSNGGRRGATSPSTPTSCRTAPYALIEMLKGNENYQAFQSERLITTEFNICEVGFAVCRNYPTNAPQVLNTDRKMVTLTATRNEDYCSGAARRTQKLQFDRIYRNVRRIHLFTNVMSSSTGRRTKKVILLSRRHVLPRFLPAGNPPERILPTPAGSLSRSCCASGVRREHRSRGDTQAYG